MKTEPSAGALKIAQAILDAQLPGLTFNGHIISVAEIIDRETGLKKLVEVADSLVSLIEGHNQKFPSEYHICPLIVTIAARGVVDKVKGTT
ncbi:hypothetical protein LCGC14_1059450 [marine sediment metagenome]|uniref:Uncharacterized protein n=1 Tax=marine sediment metagenome TaxID=412755 RepID=A0A0F9QSD4_9ZZZZ